MVKAGIFLTARLLSTRLRQKHLLPVKGKPIMSYLVDRINAEFMAEIKKKTVEVIIVSGDKEHNAPLGNAIKNCSIFYGDPDNIPKRHLQAAKSHQVDLIIAVDGDDVLCSPKAMRIIYDNLLHGENYVSTDGLPLGLNAFGYSTAFLEGCLAKVEYSLLETGWGRIFDKKALKTIKIDSRNERYLRFTLDYPQDFDFFQKILINPKFNLTGSSDKELVDLVMQEKIYSLNASIAEEYWVNFNKHKEEEEKKAREK